MGWKGEGEGLEERGGKGEKEGSSFFALGRKN